MKETFNFRSLLIGVVLTMLLFVALGAVNNPATQVDRFQIRTNNAHVFVIDTVTGQVWEKFVHDGGGTTSKDFSNSKL